MEIGLLSQWHRMMRLANAPPESSLDPEATEASTDASADANADANADASQADDPMHIDTPASSGGSGSHEVLSPSGARRKVVARVTYDAVTLKLTLTHKVLAKSLKDGCITPFLNAYNKKTSAAKPLDAAALSRVEVDGAVVPSIEQLGMGRRAQPPFRLHPPPRSSPSPTPIIRVESAAQRVAHHRALQPGGTAAAVHPLVRTRRGDARHPAAHPARSARRHLAPLGRAEAVYKVEV